MRPVGGGGDARTGAGRRTVNYIRGRVLLMNQYSLIPTLNKVRVFGFVSVLGNGSFVSPKMLLVTQSI